MTQVTCRLTAENRDQLRNPTLGNRVWATFTFYSYSTITAPFPPPFVVTIFIQTLLASSWEWLPCTSFLPLLFFPQFFLFPAHLPLPSLPTPPMDLYMPIMFPYSLGHDLQNILQHTIIVRYFVNRVPVLHCIQLYRLCYPRRLCRNAY